MVLYIIIAIVIFGVLIAVHELGHFMAAKAVGIRVNEFSIGMGPAYFKRQRGETLYALRVLPIGGYCAMEGEDEQSEDKRAFTSKGFWARFLVLIAGSGMNFITGLLIVLILFSSARGFYTTTIAAETEGSAFFQETGLQPGDKLLKVDGERVYTYSDLFTILSRAKTERVDVEIRRDGARRELRDVEFAYGDLASFTVKTERATLWTMMKNTWYTGIDFVRLVRMSLVDLFTGGLSVKDLSGPIGIVDTIGEVGASAKSFGEAMGNIAYLAAFIAVNLAVMNMLPIPALDGGRVFFLIVTTVLEKIRRKKIDPKYEGYVHMAGLVCLLGLMVFVAFNDIVKIIA